MDLGAPELILVFVIVILLFGVGRIGKLGAEAGQAIREFRRGLGSEAASVTPPSPAPETLADADQQA